LKPAKEAMRENIIFNDMFIPVKSFVNSSSEHSVHPHWHPEIEILYYISGFATQQVNDHFFTAKEGDIVIIGKNNLHSTYGYETCNIRVLQFDADAVLDLSAYEQGKENKLCFSNENVCFKMPVSSKDEYASVIARNLSLIHQELSNKNRGYGLFVRSLIYDIAGIIERGRLCEFIQQNEINSPEMRIIMEKVFNIIDENYHDEITLKDVAGISNFSVTHFCRIFKKATGMTFHNYLCFYKVKLAEKLLRTTDKTITEVALESGFGSPITLTRNFKRFKKCTPSEYKNMI
jgi:AraC-like DNA-binding protein/mannose-6-phosphate isomerase-like protein (cupin superfamily)